MKQNKKYSAIIVSIIILIANLAIPTLAYTDTSTNNIDFNGQPIAVETTPSFANATYIGINNNLKYYCTSNNSENIYIFSYDYDVQGQMICYVCPDNNPYGEINIVYDNNYGALAGKNTTTINKSSYFSQYGLYYNEGLRITSDVSVPNFSSRDAGIQAVKDWIENPPVAPAEPQPFNYSIPAGYALAVDISGLSPTGKLTTVTNRAFASPHVSNQTIAYVDSIPADGTAPLGNGISWNGIGNKDLFGRYKSWQHNLVPQPNKSYLVIYNPVHIDNYVDPEHEDYNSSINISLTEARGGRLIALNTELTSSGQVGTVSSDNGGDISYDDDTNTWNTLNPDGTPYNPSPYGDYLPNTQNSVHDWLENISNQISGFFTGAIGAITNLVSAGSAFFQTLIGLYGWLPISVMSVLSSALIIVITIGVIKVFL